MIFKCGDNLIFPIINQQSKDVPLNATGYGFGGCGLEEIKYLFKSIFSFRRSSVEAKRGVEFRHSPLNASRIHLIPSAYSAVFGHRCTVKLN